MLMEENIYGFNLTNSSDWLNSSKPPPNNLLINSTYVKKSKMVYPPLVDCDVLENRRPPPDNLMINGTKPRSLDLHENNSSHFDLQSYGNQREPSFIVNVLFSRKLLGELTNL